MKANNIEGKLVTKSSFNMFRHTLLTFNHTSASNYMQSYVKGMLEDKYFVSSIDYEATDSEFKGNILVNSTFDPLKSIELSFYSLVKNDEKFLMQANFFHDSGIMLLINTTGNYSDTTSQADWEIKSSYHQKSYKVSGTLIVQCFENNITVAVLSTLDLMNISLHFHVHYDSQVEIQLNINVDYEKHFYIWFRYFHRKDGFSLRGELLYENIQLIGISIQSNYVNISNFSFTSALKFITKKIAFAVENTKSKKSFNAELTTGNTQNFRSKMEIINTSNHFHVMVTHLVLC